jgi:hypothetical protein
MALLWSHDFAFVPLQTLWAILSTCATLTLFVYLLNYYPQSAHFGGSILPPPTAITTPSGFEHFQTPAVPYLPCLGMAINWYLYVPIFSFES